MDSCHNHQATWRRYLRRGGRKGHLISRSQTTQARRVVFLTPEQYLIPDVVQRRERNDRDIIPHVPPGLDSISSFLDRSRNKDRRVIKSTNGCVTYKKMIFFPK
ncbi:unnamed protein product [Hymenolepis diminuta]|uniref:Uncharacterized protein n=1 Tax=Hymenolepis diminuta TaxID=6216 RepID=A0A564Y7C6_HYMDI|nr:unnamed protein product [Hymenolepis diminuta]